MKRNKIVEFVSDPTKNFLTFFVVGVLLFAIIADGVSFLFWEVLGEWLQSQLSIEKSWLRAGVILILLLLLLLAIYATNLSNWVKGWLAKVPLFGIEVPERTRVEALKREYSGLIVTMSPKADSPAERAIRYHWNNGQKPKLKHCWIICTNGSLSEATKMMNQFTADGITQSVQFYYGDYSMEDVEQLGKGVSLLVPDKLLDDPDYIRKLVNCIYADAQQKGLDESEVIADYTGGTKGTTAGIILACATPERRMQYISQVQSPAELAINISYKIRSAR